MLHILAAAVVLCAVSLSPGGVPFVPVLRENSSGFVAVLLMV